MRVRVGWSGETSKSVWQRVDIELEEEDLGRLLIEAGLSEELSSRLPVKVCYRLMQNEAETRLLDKLKTLGYPEDQADSRIQILGEATQRTLEAIRARLPEAQG